MRIYPAIDLQDGKCVRLQQGKFDKVTVFGEDPVKVALTWAAQGAKRIHVVDLDGARYGSAYNNDAIKRIAAECGIPIQTGGGIRTLRDIEDKLDSGVDRVILGTAAINDPGFVKNAVLNYKERVIVGVDASHGMVATDGWAKVSTVSALDLCRKMQDLGVKTIIYTDIARDGMMQGPNIRETKNLIDALDIDVIASGGVSSMEDIQMVADINAAGVILGKSLYQGAISLEDVISNYETA